MKPNYENVQFFSIELLVDLWSPEIEIHRSVMLQELLIAAYKFAHKLELKEWIQKKPEELELPSIETTFTRSDIERIAQKQHWPLPKAIFGKIAVQNGVVGRPSRMPAIVQEFRTRMKAGEIADSVTNEAKFLEEWVDKEYPGEQLARWKAIRDKIASEFRSYNMNK